MRQGAVARGVTIEVVQQRGVGKAEFAAEMEALARTYLLFLREHWPRFGAVGTTRGWPRDSRGS